MTDYNDVGISRQLDWPRIRHLFRLGLFAALTTLIGDLLLGWGVENETLAGLPRMLSAYAASDGRILASALLGLFGLTLEGLCRTRSPLCPRLPRGDSRLCHLRRLRLSSSRLRHGVSGSSRP